MSFCINPFILPFNNSQACSKLLSLLPTVVLAPFNQFKTMALPPAPSLGEFSSSVLSSKPSEEHQLDPRLPRPTIVLVHAAWHGPETFSLIVPGLEHAGYSVTAVTLPSSNQTPAVPDISEDVKIVRNAVTSNLKLGKDVVLVMHSYGSMSGCEAMRGVAQDIANMNREKHVGIRVGKVVKLAFICGLILPLGGAAFGMERGYKGPPGFVCVVCCAALSLMMSYHRSFMRLIVENQDDLISVLDGPQRFYSDLPLDLANRWNACIKPHSRL